jgi:hypothetical protein
MLPKSRNAPGYNCNGVQHMHQHLVTLLSKHAAADTATATYGFRSRLGGACSWLSAVRFQVCLSCFAIAIPFSLFLPSFPLCFPHSLHDSQMGRGGSRANLRPAAHRNIDMCSLASPSYEADLVPQSHIPQTRCCLQRVAGNDVELALAYP